MKAKHSGVIKKIFFESLVHGLKSRAIHIRVILWGFSLANMTVINAQVLYTIDASAPAHDKILYGQLKMGNPGAKGKAIEINSRYMTLGGRPIIPVMGEMHFSRVARSQWEDRILKMKACGVNIISSYVVWIHHEEVQGNFDWSGNKNLRAFVELCAKHGLWVYPRIGPWCHGEVRNGGIPDWILMKDSLKPRSNDAQYQRYAEEWYRQISIQLKGLLYKDGGPVIGVQLENEYGLGKAGETHILWLKEIARKYGIDVPMYTVTGWGNGSVPPYEVIPLWGAYPDEPWASNLRRNEDCKNFRFSPYRNDEAIGNDLGKAKDSYIDYSAYPYFTCEVGVGIENTDHRRLQIGSLDGYGLIMAKLGSGSNLPGYYMFTGGSNPHGLLSTMEENREETGYWNTNPVISYDFQAAIRESGALNGSYFKIKKLHYFLNEFGDRLAPMMPHLPVSTGGFPYALRAKDDSAFLFGINYCRHNESTEKKGVQFRVQMKGETLLLPSQPATIEDSSCFIWPLNFKLGTILLKYATAQPLCVIGNTWIFVQDATDKPEFCFDNSGLKNIHANNGTIIKKDGRVLISDLQPGMNCTISFRDAKNVERNIVLLSKREGEQAWLLKEGNKKYFFVSPVAMYLDAGRLHIFDTLEKLPFYHLTENHGNVVFKSYDYHLNHKHLPITVKKYDPLEKAKWLKTSISSLDDKNILMHRFFSKTFWITGSSAIKKGTLISASGSLCRFRINNIWVSQDITPGAVNKLDITGYLKKGSNHVLVDFPFDEGNRAFAAKLTVDYDNADRFEAFTDTSWLVKDSYTYPTPLSPGMQYKQPDTAASIPKLPEAVNGIVSYHICIPSNCLESLKNTYLRIGYTGDKARIYFNGTLVGDDFYNGNEWTIGLNNLDNKVAGKDFLLEISALPAGARVYFDDETAKIIAQKAMLKKVELVPVYEAIMDIKTIK